MASLRRGAWRLCPVLIVLALLAASGPAWGAGSDDRPGQAAPGNSALSGHPRLFFTAADIPTLRQQAMTTHESIWAPILAFVDKWLGTLPPAASPADESLGFYRNSGNALTAMAFACVITDQDQYCDLAQDYLLIYARWAQWDMQDERDLGLAHMLLGNTLAYDWLYDRLTADEQDLVRQSLAKWAQRMYEASTLPNEYGWRNWWHKSYMQNHYWVNNSALGMAGLALANDGVLLADCSVRAAGTQAVNVRAASTGAAPITGTLAAGQSAKVVARIAGEDGHVWWELDSGGWVRADVVRGAEDCRSEPLNAQRWIDQAQDRYAIGQRLLDGIADGSWHEGMNYQNYLLTMALPFWVNLRDLTGIDRLPHTYLQNYVYWRLYNCLPNSTDILLPYGNLETEWTTSRSSHAVLRYLAHEYNDGYAAWTADQIIAASGRDSNIFTAPWYVFEFFYYDPAVVPRPPTDLPGTRVFPDLAGVIWRTGWEPGDLAFGLKTGGFGGGFAFDTFVAEEAPWETPCSETKCQLNVGHDHNDTNGFYLYQNGWLAPEGAGYSLYDTSHHNTLLIDGQGQSAPSSERSWRYPGDFANSAGALEITADAPHFNFLVADATRRYSQIEGITQVRRYVVFIRPDLLVMFDRVTAEAPRQVDWVVHLEGGASVEGRWIRGRGAGDQLLGVGVAAPQAFAVTTGTDELPFVRVHPEQPAASTLFALILYPTDSSGWEARPAAALVEQTAEAAALRLEPNDNSGRTVDVLLAFEPLAAPVEIAGYRFDGRIAVITRGPDGALQALFTQGGTFLAEQAAAERMLVEGLSAEADFEAIFSGTTVAVTGDLPGAVTLFAPTVEHLILNGSAQSFQIAGRAIVF